MAHVNHSTAKTSVTVQHGTPEERKGKAARLASYIADHAAGRCIRWWPRGDERRDR